MPDMRITVFDVETTGLDPARHRVLTFAGATALVDPTSRVRDTDPRHFLTWRAFVVEPSESSPHWQSAAESTPEAMSIHGLTRAQLEGHARLLDNDPWARTYEALEFLRGSVLVGWRLDFDLAFLLAAATRHLTDLDLPAMSAVSAVDLRNLLPKEDGQHRSLSRLAEQVGLGGPLAHSAVGDVLAVIRLLSTVPSDITWQEAALPLDQQPESDSSLWPLARELWAQYAPFEPGGAR